MARKGSRCCFSRRRWSGVVSVGGSLSSSGVAKLSALLTRADQSVVDVTLLAGAVVSTVGGGVGWFGVLLVS